MNDLGDTTGKAMFSRHSDEQVALSCDALVSRVRCIGWHPMQGVTVRNGIYVVSIYVVSIDQTYRIW